MDWKSLIKGVAPVVGTALGGPLGGAAVSIIADALGLSEKTEEAIKNVIGQGLTPEQEVALQLAEKNFALEQLKINVALQTRLAELEVDDRNKAREREANVKDNTNRNLAYAIVGGFIALVGSTLLGFAEVDSALAGTLVGYLSAKCEQVLSYYFGSTRTSEQKTNLLAQQGKK